MSNNLFSISQRRYLGNKQKLLKFIENIINLKLESYIEFNIGKSRIKNNEKKIFL